MSPDTVTIENEPETVATPDPLTERTRAIWTSGDFGKIAVSYADGAAAFVERLAIGRGETVLDVACGTGNLALPAAVRGARVTGVDIAPNLIHAARAASAAAGLSIRFDVGDAEALPYPNASFDTVISMFGVMFAPRPDRALAELLRVTRPGGRIALANWVADGFIGSMLRAHVARVAPPPGVPSVLGWGDEKILRHRLMADGTRIRRVEFTPRKIAMTYPMSPAAVVELFREFYGPSLRTFTALDAQGRAALNADLLALWSGANAVADGGTLVMSEYLETRIEKA